MRWTTRPGWPGNLLAVAAGALTPLTLAPFDIWALSLLSLAVFYLGLRGGVAYGVAAGQVGLGIALDMVLKLLRQAQIAFHQQIGALQRSL